MIKFDNLDKEFKTEKDFIQPIYEPNTPVLAFWFELGKWRLCTIVKATKKGYDITFTSKSKIFSDQRPDAIMPMTFYDNGEEILALWGGDHKFYPAKIITQTNLVTWEIQFDGIKKTFLHHVTKLRKMPQSKLTKKKEYIVFKINKKVNKV
jgi:hypothetical protein